MDDKMYESDLSFKLLMIGYNQSIKENKQLQDRIKLLEDEVETVKKMNEVLNVMLEIKRIHNVEPRRKRNFSERV